MTAVVWFSPILQLLLAGGSFLIKERNIFCSKEKNQLQQIITCQLPSVLRCFVLSVKWLKFLTSVVLLSNSENPWFPLYLGNSSHVPSPRKFMIMSICSSPDGCSVRS